MPNRKRGESGQYEKTISDEEILEFIREQGGAPTHDVAEEFGYAQPSAYRRLRELDEDGRVSSRMIGNSLLWEVDE